MNGKLNCMYVIAPVKLQLHSCNWVKSSCKIGKGNGILKRA